MDLLVIILVYFIGWICGDYIKEIIEDLQAKFKNYYNNKKKEKK